MKLNVLLLEDYLHLKEGLKNILDESGFDVQYVTYTKETQISVLKDAAKFIQESPQESRAIIIDDFGILPFMVTTKYHSIICAQLSEEHSALMTRDHNNSNVISVGAEVAGPSVINAIVKRFVYHDYAGGRHQIRIDMLESMGGS